MVSRTTLRASIHHFDCRIRLSGLLSRSRLSKLLFLSNVFKNKSSLRLLGGLEVFALRMQYNSNHKRRLREEITRTSPPNIREAIDLPSRLPAFFFFALSSEQNSCDAGTSFLMLMTRSTPPPLQAPSKQKTGKKAIEKSYKANYPQTKPEAGANPATNPNPIARATDY